ncbi:hypothetical protein F5Y11DRAFT_352322 [Daldinia sp. FL1419]|nr:hypothetical protein F5Y11DRAFT_352322 [Daldinia sp. FL1419]
MEKLPEGIIALVVSFLPPPGLAHYAVLSRQWQQAVERHAFSILNIESTDLDVFKRIVWANAKRRTSLQRLRFTGALTREWRLLFNVLQEDGDKRGISLELGYYETTGISLAARKGPPLAIDIGDDSQVVDCVSALTLAVDTPERRIALRTAVDLARRLPRLKSIAIAAQEAEEANVLIDANFLSDSECERVSLLLEQHDPLILEMRPRWRHRYPFNANSYGPLGAAAMRRWSYNLVFLEVVGVFDGSLFFPRNSEDEKLHRPNWPRLEELHVKLGLTTPSGDWYFEEEPGTHRRNVPREEEKSGELYTINHSG